MRPDLDPNAIDSVAPERLLERLRELPDEAPPYDYSEFSRRYSRRRVRQSQLPLRLTAAALAVVVAGWFVRHQLGPTISDVATVATPQTTEWPLSSPPTNAERWLNEQPRPAIVRVPTQMAVAQLEDQIATMDDQLTVVRLSQPQAQQLAGLQRDRAQMVESLAQVRYAQNLVAGSL
jgi:hypothetical protein